MGSRYIIVLEKAEALLWRETAKRYADTGISVLHSKQLRKRLTRALSLVIFLSIILSNRFPTRCQDS